jgi:hypothetical protein
MFLEKLVPEQLRAITRLCGTIHDLQFLSQPLISRFKGLKHIDMNIVVSSQYTRCGYQSAYGEVSRLSPALWH